MKEVLLDDVINVGTILFFYLRSFELLGSVIDEIVSIKQINK